jgi:hypothetical protein
VTRMSKRATAYHEAAHAVAAFFYPLGGKTERVFIGGDELARCNAEQQPVNTALGIHRSTRTLPAIVNRSVDREQVHHILICLLEGYAASWVFEGERYSLRKPTKLDAEEMRKHADGSDDFSRAWQLLSDSDPFDTHGTIRDLGLHEATGEELLQRGHEAIEAHTAQLLERFEALWREAVALVSTKWPHIVAVGDALLRKQTLDGIEVVEIIELIEERLESYPPQVRELLERLRPAPEPRPLQA